MKLTIAVVASLVVVLAGCASGLTQDPAELHRPGTDFERELADEYRQHVQSRGVKVRLADTFIVRDGLAVHEWQVSAPLIRRPARGSYIAFFRELNGRWTITKTQIGGYG